MNSQEVLAIVTSFKDALVGAILEGWSAWKSEDYPPGHNPRLRANVVNSWIWHRALEKLEPQGLKPVEEGNQRYMALDSRLRIRFKKMDRFGASGNVQTRQQRNLRRFGAPSAQATLDFGVEPSTGPQTVYLEVGYVLDPAEAHVDRVLVVTRGPNRWSEELWARGRDLEQSTTVPQQMAPMPPAEAPAAARVKRSLTKPVKKDADTTNKS